MHLINRSKINRPVSAVWQYVIKTDKFILWNKKIESMSAQREFTLNQYFSTLYNWRGKKSQCKSIAIRIIEEGLLELRHSEFVGKNMPHDMVVAIDYCQLG